MGINLNGSIGSLYLGSTKIKEAYLGSIKVFGSEAPFVPVVVPAKTMRFRFRDSSYDPRVALPSESSTWYQGTWTKVNGTGYNDWDWYYNSTSWMHGPYKERGTSITNGTHLIDIEFDIIGINSTGVTNMDYLFSNMGVKNIYGTLDMTNVTTSYSVIYLVTGCKNLERLPNITQFTSNCIIELKSVINLRNLDVLENIRYYSSYYNSFNLSVLAGYDIYDFTPIRCNSHSGCTCRLLNKNSNITSFIPYKYYIDNNITIGTNLGAFREAFAYSNIHGYAKDYLPNTSVIRETNIAMISTFLCSTIDYAYTANDFPMYARGSWYKAFDGCFNLKNFTECANLINTYASTSASDNKLAFHLAGMNSAAGRAELAALSTTLGGGVKQDFRNIYLNNGCLPPEITMMSSTTSHTLGVSFFWPKSMRAPDSTRKYNFHMTQSSTSFTRSIFSGHGNYKGLTSSDTTKALNIYFGIIQMDDNGDITWSLLTSVVKTIASGSSSVKGSRNYTNWSLNHMLTSDMTANDFDDNKTVLMNFIAVYEGESNMKKNYFLMHGPAGGSYGWANTSYKMLELQDITVGTYLDD